MRQRPDLSISLSVLAFWGCYGAPAPSNPPPVPPPPPGDAAVPRRPTNIDAVLVERAPASFTTVTLPEGVEPFAPWVNADGRGFVVSTDSRLFAINGSGIATELERVAGDMRGPMESPPNALIESTSIEPMALLPDGALTVREGRVRRASLPTLLRNATTVIRWGSESLWATREGLYTTQGPRWLRIDRGGSPVTDITTLVTGATTSSRREVWVLRSNGDLLNLSVQIQTGDTVAATWSDPVNDYAVGTVRAIGSLGTDRYIARSNDLLRVSADGQLGRIRFPGMFAGPTALVRTNTWLWILWGGESESAIGRYDGTTLEVFARGVYAMGGRIAVDPRGDSALIAHNRRLRRLVADAAPVVIGFADGASVTESRLALQIDPPSPESVSRVVFRLDGDTLEEVTTAPYRWGVGGDLYRALPGLTFREHAVTATIQYRGAPDVVVRRSFRYVSPLGRVPTYTADIARLYQTECARCHSTAIARDLRGYAALSRMGRNVAEVVQSRRMPPDLTLDAPSLQLFSAWVSGGMPE
jgi:hypothetical protein